MTNNNIITPAPIRNLDELHLAIHGVKQRISNRETELEQRWNSLPQETIKAAVEAVIPVLLHTRMAAGAWRVVKSLLGLFTGKTDSTGAGSLLAGLLAGARQLGIFALLKLLFRFWSGKTAAGASKI